MKVERETAGVALPFTAGILLAALSGYSHTHSITYIGILVSFSLSLILLMHPGRRRFGTGWQWLLIGIAALSTGMICGHISSQIELSDPGISHGLRRRAEEWGLQMQNAIDRLPFSDRTCNAVAKALITGERSDIPKEIVLAFRESGASHILALSGLHLGIIYAIITFSLSIFGNHHRLRIPRFIIIVLLCGSYTLATGAGPSIVRAFLFIGLAETGRLMHRHFSTAQIFFSALIIQLALSPASIRSAGFQLSYAAMAGIAFIQPRLRSFWPGRIHDDRLFTRCVRKIWNASAMSISCQITTAPLVFIYFGTMPEYFLLTNLITLPLTGILIPVTLATLVLDCIGLCPAVAIRTAETLIQTLIWALKVIAGM